MPDNEQNEQQVVALELSPDDLPKSPWHTLLRPVFDPRYVSGIYSVPRRFDLATIFVVTAAYSLLLGGLSALDATPIVKTVVAGFVTMIAVAQAALVKLVHPRGTSIVVGAVINLIFTWLIWLEIGRRIPIPFVVVALTGVLIGGFLGYLTGTVVGGVFLIADLLRGRFDRRQPPIDVDDIPLEEVE
jgi:hypothetical protein